MTETSLAIMTQAEKMLAQATTIQSARELKDLALTAADWAKRKGLGDEAIAHARRYSLLAERRMGELIKEAQEKGTLAKGGQPKKEPCPMGRVKTLNEIGLSWNESSKAQMLADLPDFIQAVERRRAGK